MARPCFKTRLDNETKTIRNKICKLHFIEVLKWQINRDKEQENQERLSITIIEMGHESKRTAGTQSKKSA